MLSRRDPKKELNETKEEKNIGPVTNPNSILNRIKRSISGEKEHPEKMLDSIKKTLYGNQNDLFLTKVDTALDNISDTIINKSSMNYADLIKTLIVKSTDAEKSNIFDDLPQAIAMDVETSERINRYINAKEIVDNIPYCARTLKVLTDGILSPDDVTKKTLQVLQEGSDNTEDRAAADVRDIVKKLKLDEYMSEAVEQTLWFGDHFIELCDYKSKDVPVSSTLLREGTLTVEEQKVLNDTEHECTFKYKQLNEETKQFDNKEKKLSVKIEITESKADEMILEVEKDENDKEEKTHPMDDVRLIVHNPQNIIKLQSRRYKMCLGYLVLPEFDIVSSGSAAGAMSRIGSSMGVYRSNSNTSSPGGLSSLSGTSGIDNLYRSLVRQMKLYLKKDEIKIDKSEVMTILQRTLEEIDLEDPEVKDLIYKVRFVPTDRMEHFIIDKSRFYPYGESIFYKSTNKAKLLILLETATTVKRVSDSKDLRIINVETGLPRDVRNTIEDMKNAFKKRKFSVDSLGTISSIPSTITMYEDIYIPQTKGKRFVEFDRLEPTAQIRDMVDELKYFRDSIVSNMEVPPVYLNQEENLSNKAALTFENQLFAQTITLYQFRFSKPLNSFIRKLYKFIKGERLAEDIFVSFPPPKMLQMERDAEKYDMILRIVQASADMGLDRKYVIKKYLDQDWDEERRERTKNDMDDKIIPKKNEDELGMGGIGGGLPPIGGGY